MRHNILPLIFFVVTFCTTYSQDDFWGRILKVDTIQVRQSWKELVWEGKDLSYLHCSIPNTAIRSPYDLNNDRCVIHCIDGCSLFMNTSPAIPEYIKRQLVREYGSECADQVESLFFDSLMCEFFRVDVLGLDSTYSLFYPPRVVYGGVDSLGLYWKYVRIGYSSISYQQVPLEAKKFYDFILEQWFFIDPNKVTHYTKLPLNY